MSAIQSFPRQRMVTTVEVVTPDIARELLSSNGTNRPITQAAVDKIVTSILDGEWRLTHQGIAISADGTLLDGQHRLLAVVKTGVAVETLVTRNVDPETFEVMDSGRSRQQADTVGIAGVQNSKGVTAISRLILSYDSHQSRPWNRVKSMLTTPRVKAFAVENDAWLQVAHRQGLVVAKRIGGAPAAHAAGLFVCRRWAAANGVTDLADEWSAGLMTGAQLLPGDPRLAFASWISGAGRLINAAYRSELTFILALRVFHAGIQGDSLQKVLVRDPGSTMFRLPE